MALEMRGVKGLKTTTSSLTA